MDGPNLGAMIVSCPECGARYKLPDDAIPPEGRAMRCASCKHRWFELGAEDAPPVATGPLASLPLAPSADPARAAARPAAMPKRLVPDAAAGEAAGELAPSHVATADPGPVADTGEHDAAPAPPARTLLKTIVALLLSAMLCAGAAAMWLPDLPPLDLARVPWLDALIHPPAPPRSQLTVGFTVDRQPVGDGRTVFALTGTLANPTAVAQPVPHLEARLLDAGGRVTYRWPVAVPRASLPAHRALPIEASAVGDAAGGARVVVAMR